MRNNINIFYSLVIRHLLGMIFMNFKVITLLLNLLAFSLFAQGTNAANQNSTVEQKEIVKNEQQVPTELSDEQRRKMLASEAEKENWSKVFELILPLAQKGDREAQVNLGILYYKGQGVKKDLAKAYWWLNEAAERGNVKALNNLGLFFLKGYAVAKNIPHSIKLFEYSAQLGSQEATFILGQIYEDEMKDLKKAFYWFKKSADAGNSNAKYRLALMYEFGEGTKRDKKKASLIYKEIIAEGGYLTEEAKSRLNKLSNKF